MDSSGQGSGSLSGDAWAQSTFTVQGEQAVGSGQWACVRRSGDGKPSQEEKPTCMRRPGKAGLGSLGEPKSWESGLLRIWSLGGRDR